MINIIIFIALVIGLLTIIIVLLVINKTIKDINYKQEVIWDYMMSRAELEFLHKGMGKKD
jgi:hypothetical protein